MEATAKPTTASAMAERTDRSTSHGPLTSPVTLDTRAARILAKAIYKEARGAGVEGPGLVAVATELLSLVAQEMRAARQ